MIRYLLTCAALIAAMLFSSSSVVAKTKKQPVHRASSKSKKFVHRSSKRVRASSRRSKRGRHAKPAAAASWRSRQLSPTSDRYREIQEALASKGYLKSSPNGSWDSESQEALRHFQADQNIQQTGKVNSISLIALGLGPAKTGGAAPAPPPSGVTPSEPSQ